MMRKMIPAPAITPIAALALIVAALSPEPVHA